MSRIIRRFFVICSSDRVGGWKRNEIGFFLHLFTRSFLLLYTPLPLKCPLSISSAKPKLPNITYYSWYNNSPYRSFPLLEISKDKGFGTFSVQMSSARSVLTPKRAFLPTFMYCLPITFGDPVPNKDVINFIVDLCCDTRRGEERYYLELARRTNRNNQRHSVNIAVRTNVFAFSALTDSN